MSTRTELKKRNASCAVCASSDLGQVVDLPQFPLTGIYLDPKDPTMYPNIDQGLMVCQACGHGQLRYSVSPEFLYGPSYSHRSSASPIATTGNDFFLRFLHGLDQGPYKAVLEIGCNDLYLLRKLSTAADLLVGIDPIWEGRESEVKDDKIKVIGGLLENINLGDVLPTPPDLVLSVHCFEHMGNPREQLERLMTVADENTLFVIEVPGFDSLLGHARFDQVFHQHIQYFSLASFARMVNEVGGQYVAHTFNYAYWGGTLLIAFRKALKGSAKATAPSFPKPTTDATVASYQTFTHQIAALMDVLGGLKGERIYGYGAAQMVPTLAYHMRSDLGFLEAILDDNPDRGGLRYPGLSARIENRSESLDLRDASVIVTALDSARPILQRLLQLKPRRILVPLNVL